jgi:site-specific DNA-cytosine methylase
VAQSTKVPYHLCTIRLLTLSLRFIFSVLTALGYQCQIAILQAAEYGCPQSRKRVIVWASLPGYGLPKFPQPSHVFSGRSGGTNFHRERKSAPHFPITVGDALTDLPKFEWKNCHKELEETNEQRIDREARGKKGIAQLPTLKSNGFVGFKEQPYASKLPLSEYQRRMRKGVSSEKLHNHITGIPSELTCERVCNVPLEVKADHRSIPAKLLDGRGTCEAGEYGRLGFEDQFKIATTQISRWVSNLTVAAHIQLMILIIRTFIHPNTELSPSGKTLVYKASPMMSYGTLTL